MITPINANATEKRSNIIPAGIMGAGVGALLGRVSPLTHFEHDRAFTKEVKENISQKLAGVGKDQFESAKFTLEKEVVKNAKKSRPLAYFAAIGAAVLMTAAVVKNAVVAKKAKEEQVSISYDKEGMIIDAPDSLALAIILDEKA